MYLYFNDINYIMFLILTSSYRDEYKSLYLRIRYTKVATKMGFKLELLSLTSNSRDLFEQLKSNILANDWEKFTAEIVSAEVST